MTRFDRTRAVPTMTFPADVGARTAGLSLDHRTTVSLGRVAPVVAVGHEDRNRVVADSLDALPP
ncbi:hypothetical protein GCM10012275_15930 [Longimycelium tulufanense]|uniref:Uncharacterized protein n=1 Tax=Longimycelium tulufanense TaxID=907463 RepID=A0A8J3CCE3_9PSEU|nr:hypothetical protein [Longimycelium tulufanense]GGM45698.1 hypothetical protein GCM10012275_15930 [Longimycelium tulufanense]